MKQLLALAFLLATFVGSAYSAPKTVATVNGKGITAWDVRMALAAKKLDTNEQSSQSDKVIEELIDGLIIHDFLKEKRITAAANEVAERLQSAKEALKNVNDEFTKQIVTHSDFDERLKSEIGLFLAWRMYCNQTITAAEMKDYFEKHRAELDGTRLRGRQIFLKLPPNRSQDEVDKQISRLKELKSEIVAGKIKFEDAAATHSESPSKEKGGDLGTFGIRGQLPTPVARAAFELKVQEISDPVVSQFGVHLIQVTDRIAGDLSLEDVRPQIMDALSNQLWKDTVARERKMAKIERQP